MHHPAGRVLRIGKPLLDKNPVLGRQGRQHILDFIVFQFLDDVDGVIGVEVGQLPRQCRDTHHMDNLIARVLIKIGQSFRVQTIAERAHKRRRLRSRQPFEKVGLVCRVERRDERPRTVFRPLGDGSDDRGLDLRGQPVERRQPVTVIATIRRIHRFGGILVTHCLMLVFRRHAPCPSACAGRAVPSGPAWRED